MEKEVRIYRNGKVSEKALERKLRKEIEGMGGECLKYYNPWAGGYPDRLCLLPGGVTVWVELKSAGKRPTRLQEVRMDRLREMGGHVLVVDSEDALEDAVEFMRFLADGTEGPEDPDFLP